MHPVEKKTNGLYSNPVAILDFASLYPTLYRAHNLCYTTLLHKDDAASFPADQVTETPIGDSADCVHHHGGCSCINDNPLHGSYQVLTAARRCDCGCSQPADTPAAPTGEKYVKQEVRRGILPSILAALMNARAATRAALKEVPPDQPSKRAVLDSRQKALKLTANALYGFTGAQASPLQCVPLADSCLAMGCRVNATSH